MDGVANTLWSAIWSIPLLVPTIFILVLSYALFMLGTLNHFLMYYSIFEGKTKRKQYQPRETIMLDTRRETQ